ncbi:hypothetical protein K504DRAFT_496497 [Pleomassaria siparia CBS 279.74]|uniref:Uncharacterized protein n=1 Tax=Pleomassaria siparia CBS 279.74 TaxID=1314801 RepID=A0A6G1KPU9_9PLEO|nr:hypothetical protein K504DRAFT_496497 [Pleomassaria siparia CBS 279.74]
MGETGKAWDGDGLGNMNPDQLPKIEDRNLVMFDAQLNFNNAETWLFNHDNMQDTLL